MKAMLLFVIVLAEQVKFKSILNESMFMNR